METPCLEKKNIIVKTTQDHYDEVLEIGTAVQSAFKTDKDRIYTGEDETSK